MHVKGVKKMWSDMKSMVKQVIRAAGIVNRHDVVVRNWSPRKVMHLYLGVRHVFDFPCLSGVKRRRYEKMSWKTYFNVLSIHKGKLFGNQ